MVEQEFVELLVVGSIPTLGNNLRDNIFMDLNTSKINNKPTSFLQELDLEHHLHPFTDHKDLKSKKPRILVTLNYNEENHVELSENARLTFFGRV